LKRFNNLKLYFKSPLYKQDLKNVILYALLLTFGFGIAGGLVNGVIDYLLSMTSLSISIRFIFYFLIAYFYAKVIFKKHSSGHIIYKLIAVVGFILLLFIFVFVSCFIGAILITKSFNMLLIGNYYLYTLRSVFYFWSYFVITNSYGVISLVNYLLSIVIFVLCIRRVFLYSSYAYIV